MKRLFGGMIAVLCLATGIVFNFAGDTLVGGNHFIPRVGESGIFIVRDNAAADNASHFAAFTGGITEDMNLLLMLRANAPANAWASGAASRSTLAFKFEAVKWMGSRWWTADEYHSAFHPHLNSGAIGPWFHVDERVWGSGANSFAEWRFRKRLPAGLYGIRGTVVEIWHISGVEQVLPVAIDYNGEMTRRYWDDQDTPRSSVFTILYGDELNAIQLSNEHGQSLLDVRQYGWQGFLALNFRPNAGAIDDWYIQLNLNHAADFETGSYQERQNIRATAAEFSVTRRGVDVTHLFNTWTSEYTPYTIDLTGPARLSRNRYVVTVWHSSNPAIVGTFIIDNGQVAGGATGAARVIGIMLLVLGIIAILGGTILFTGPRIAHSVQTLRYKMVENKIYGSDRKTIKAKEKAAREAAKNGEAVEPVYKARSQSFLDSMRENRARRDAARDAGMTTEEFAEAEKARKAQEEKKSYSMSEVREKLDPKPVVEEVIEQPKAQSPRRSFGEPEVDLLDSVKDQTAFADEEFVRDVVKANVDTGSDDDETPDAGTRGGFLSKIKHLTGE